MLIKISKTRWSIDPGIDIVGLPDKAVQESKNRVQAAIKNAGLFFPRKRLVVNLAPASVRKEGPAYDLPIALGVLICANQLDPELVEGSLIVGELSLDGGVRHSRGVLPMAAVAHSQDFKRIFIPEAALIPDLEVIPVPSVAALYCHLKGSHPIRPQAPVTPEDLPTWRRPSNTAPGRSDLDSFPTYEYWAGIGNSNLWYIARQYLALRRCHSHPIQSSRRILKNYCRSI